MCNNRCSIHLFPIRLKGVTGLLGSYFQARQGDLIQLGQLPELRRLQLEFDRLFQVRNDAEKRLAALAANPAFDPATLSWDKPESWKNLAEAGPDHQKELVKLAQAQMKELAKNRVCPTLLPILERAVQAAAEAVARLEEAGQEPEVLAQARRDLGEIKRRHALVRSYKATDSPRVLLHGLIPL